VALAVEGWLLLNLTRQNGRLLLRIEDLEKRLGVPVMSQKPVPAPIHVGLSVGAPAPAFELPILSGEMLSLDVLRRDRLPVLLIFSDPNCGPCSALLPEINSWQQDFAGQIVIAVVSRGDAKANRAKVDQHKLKNILLQRDREVAEQYQANGTPVAVLVRADGTIGSRVVTGAEAIKELVMRTTALGWGLSSNGNGRKLPVASPQMGLAIGEPAPPINLPDLVGKTVTLEDFKGTKTLLLFWNPGCGYCQRMLEDLKAWEDDLPQSAPQLVLVSTGGAEANLAMGLRSQVLLDASFRVGNSFQATGTPSAVLLDEGGKIASELIVGAPGVLALAGMREVRPTIAVRSVVSVQSQAN
jgi:peroxiredoxin